MHNLQITKSGYFIALFMMVMLLPVNAFATAQPADNWLDEPVILRFQNEPLSKVLEKVSKQTGIAILYDQELANEIVSGNYKDVKASDAINRLFSGKNKSIQISKDNKVIVVKTFGAKNFIWAGTTEGQENSSQMTLAELEKLHVQQYKEYKERIANDNEVLEGGMTLGELRDMHTQQSKEYQVSLANDELVLEGGITRGEVRAMHEQQYMDYQARIANGDEILEDGKTRGELRVMIEKQSKDYQVRLSNDDGVIEGGMNRAELRDMHTQQSKQYQVSIKSGTRIITN